ncbi:hypothetical protein JSMCR1_p679 (plasmid) [Escherichia coli]|nr:hypothetical protein JSMCR1_p679 [Escherichia coli]
MLFISFFITVKYHFIFLLKEPAAGTGKTSFLDNLLKIACNF